MESTIKQNRKSKLKIVNNVSLKPIKSFNLNKTLNKHYGFRLLKD